MHALIPKCFLCVGVSPLYRQAWDLAVDICLSQLPTIIEEGTAFRVSFICVCERKINSETSSASHERWKKLDLTTCFFLFFCKLVFVLC